MLRPPGSQINTGADNLESLASLAMQIDAVNGVGRTPGKLNVAYGAITYLSMGQFCPINGDAQAIVVDPCWGDRVIRLTFKTIQCD
jgi:hypothetical protein